MKNTILIIFIISLISSSSITVIAQELEKPIEEELGTEIETPTKAFDLGIRTEAIEPLDNVCEYIEKGTGRSIKAFYSHVLCLDDRECIIQGFLEINENVPPEEITIKVKVKEARLKFLYNLYFSIIAPVIETFGGDPNELVENRIFSRNHRNFDLSYSYCESVLNLKGECPSSMRSEECEECLSYVYENPSADPVLSTGYYAIHATAFVGTEQLDERLEFFEVSDVDVVREKQQKCP